MLKKDNIIKCIIYSIPFLWMIIMYFSKNIIYYVCDDAMMNNIARGFFDGKIDDHVIILNIVLGYILKLLYSITLSVNWFAILYMLIILLCAYVAIIIFSKKTNKYLALIVAMTLESMCIYWFSFTVIAYTCLALGILQFVCCLQTTEDESKKKVFGKCGLAVVLIVISYLLRQKAMYSGTLMFIPTIIYGIKNRINIKRVLAIGLTTIAIIVSFGILHSYEYSSKLWKHHMDFGIARVKVIDYPISSYDDEKDFYNSIGYSKNDVACATQWCFGDEEVFNVSNYYKIVNNTPFTTRYAVYPASYIPVIKKYVFALSWLSIFLFILMSVISIVFARKKLLLLFQGIFVLGTAWITFFLQRPLPRVIVPILVTGMVTMAFLFMKEKESRNTKKYCIIFGIIMSIMFVFFTIKNISNVKQYKSVYNTKQTTVTKLADKNKESLFLCKSKTDLIYNAPVVSYKGKEVCENLMQIGDQDIYNREYYNQLKDLKVNKKYLNRLILNLVYRNNTYLVVDEEKDKDYQKIVETYLQEHVKGKINCSTVKTLDNSIKVLKFECETD